MGAGNIEDEVAPLQMRLYIAQQAVKDLEKIRTYIYFKAELLDWGDVKKFVFSEKWVKYR